MIVFNAKDAGAQLGAMQQQYRYINNMRSDHRHALNPALFGGMFIDNRTGLVTNQARSENAQGQLVNNAGVRPGDLYREFDNTTVRQFRLDEGDNILNRLMPLSRSLPIGRTTFEYAASSNLGGFQSSMSGELAQVYDSVDYDGRKAIIPVHQNAFKRGWREGEQMGLEGFDDAVVQQAEAVRTHRNGLIDYMLDGNPNVSEKGVTWLGFRGDTSVHQVDLGAGGLNVDFTSGTATGADLRDAFIELRNELWLTNKVSVPATYFVSNEILANFERYYSDNYASGSILQQLRTVGMVADIVGSSKLTGNQILAMPLQSQFVQPLTGMAVSAIALPRQRYNDPFAFDVVSAVGILVRNDFGAENKGAMYAAG